MHLLTTGTYLLMPVHCRYTDEDVHSHARDINSLQLFLHTVVEIWTKVDDALKEKYVYWLMFFYLKGTNCALETCAIVQHVIEDNYYTMLITYMLDQLGYELFK